MSVVVSSADDLSISNMSSTESSHQSDPVCDLTRIGGSAGRQTASRSFAPDSGSSQ